MIYGLDLLGLASYPKENVKEIAETWPEGYALGVFATTFGNPIPFIRQILETGKCPHLRVQLIYRGSHKYGDADIPELKKLSKKYGKLAEEFEACANVTLSPFCEHGLVRPDKYCHIVRDASMCRPVNCPLDSGALSADFDDEVHGTNVLPPSDFYHFSYDGQSATRMNINKMKQRHKDARIFFLWHARFNGKKWDFDTTPISQRKAWPDAEFVNKIAGLVR